MPHHHASEHAPRQGLAAGLPDQYRRLAEALDALANGFPRTESGIELLVLRKIFSPEEAGLAALLGERAESFEAIALRAGQAVSDARRKLFAMAKKGMVWPAKVEGKMGFRLAPFVVGVYEAQTDVMDHELAHLFEDYMAEGGAVKLMGMRPALHRVVPARGSVKTESILPYEDVKAILMAARSFTARNCICRVEQNLMGTRRCTAPVKNCLGFSDAERPARPDDISRGEALAILDKAEEAGLVHTVSNVAQGLAYVCNCCGCCCAVLRGITEYGIAGSVARANYAAAIDPGACTGCGACRERCQVGAIEEAAGVCRVLPDRCIGCGLCVTGCVHGAAALSRLPDAQVVQPPADYAAWERARHASRAAAGSDGGRPD